MRKALIVGIDYYEFINPLRGCVRDAREVASVLERHHDGSLNFDVRPMMAAGPGSAIARSTLKQAVYELFRDNGDIALLYFAGHGHVESSGGYLMASDARDGDDGLPLNDVLKAANTSRATNKVIILDSCHSGVAGNFDPDVRVAELAEGLTILTASADDQAALEKGGAGVFTTLLVDALGGAAANLVGDITPGSVYAHIDQSLGDWDQRPLFKTNVRRFISLRKGPVSIAPPELRRIREFFRSPDATFPLDPSFEPERPVGSADDVPAPDPSNTAVFALLQRFNRMNLVVPVDAPHMWHAAMQSTGCKLTVLGKHYWQLVERGRL